MCGSRCGCGGEVEIDLEVTTTLLRVVAHAKGRTNVRFVCCDMREREPPAIVDCILCMYVH